MISLGNPDIDAITPCRSPLKYLFLIHIFNEGHQSYNSIMRYFIPFAILISLPVVARLVVRI